MKGYVRARSKRFATLEARAGLPGEQPRGRSQETGAEEISARFTRAFEQVVEGSAPRGEREGLLSLLHCSGRQVDWVFACGERQQALEAWCRSPYCPACAQRRGSDAARFVRDHWEGSRFLVVSIPLEGSGTLPLPSEEAVAQARATWGPTSQAIADRTGLARLEPVPRTVLGPDGITLFCRLPWEDVTSDLASVAEEELVRATNEETGAAGYPDARAAIVSREAVAIRFRQAVVDEAERFTALVSSDLKRHTTLSWRDEFPNDASRDATLRAVARRWLDVVRQRHKTRRRRVVLGARDSLPAPDDSSTPDFAKRVCPVHGRSCRPVSTLVQEGVRNGKVLQQVAGSMTGATSRQEIAAFLRETAGSVEP